MREHLIGYLLNACDPQEREAVDAHLERDESLKCDLETLRGSLYPLACDKEHHDPPPGLAQRCCQFVYSRIEVMPAALSRARGGATPRRWSWLDLSVAGAIAASVAVFILPAIYKSRVQAQLTACTNNLKEVGTALASYSDRHDGYFPVAPADRRLSAAGMWAPTLVSEGLLDGRKMICPSTPLAAEGKFCVPKLEELREMSDEQIAKILPRLAGSYGYTLGYRDADGRVQPQKNRHRATFALASDEPDSGPGNSPNHGREGQNVLFEDGHVKYLKSRRPNGEDSDIFRNAEGKIGPGLHANDSVIVPSNVPAAD